MGMPVVGAVGVTVASPAAGVFAPGWVGAWPWAWERWSVLSPSFEAKSGAIPADRGVVGDWSSSSSTETGCPVSLVMSGVTPAA